MKFLKGLALSLLSFFLFLSLSILGLAFMLNSTILNPDFIIRELDKLHVYSLASEFLDEQILQFKVDARYKPYVTKVLNDTLTDLQPWIKEKVNDTVYTAYDYFMGRSQRLDLAISLEPVRDSLKKSLREAILASPPPELQELPPGAIELVLNEASQQIDEQIPPSWEFNQNTLDPETVTTLEQIRQGIGHFQLGYKLLIGFILLLILGITLIIREVRGATRDLGITLLTCGVIIYLGNLATKYFAKVSITQLPLPAQLQTLVPQLLSDSLAPLDMYSIILAAIGIVLLVVSFVYKSRQSEIL